MDLYTYWVWKDIIYYTFATIVVCYCLELVNRYCNNLYAIQKEARVREQINRLESITKRGK